MSETPQPSASLPPELQRKLYFLLRSRKFWATVIAIAFIALGPRTGIEQQELTAAAAFGSIGPPRGVGERDDRIARKGLLPAPPGG